MTWERITTPRQLAPLLRRRVKVHLRQATSSHGRGRLLCPVCDTAGWHLTDLIHHLWAGHSWSRRRIADWLDLVEAVDEIEVEVRR